MGDAGDHLRRAPAGRFRVRDLLVPQIDVDGVVSCRRIERRVHIVVEGEAAGAVEDHVPPGRAIGTVAQIARPVEILGRIHQRLLDPEIVLPGLRELELLAVLVGELLPVVGVLEQVLAHVLDVHVAVGRNAVGLTLVGHEVGVVGDGLDLEIGLLHVLIERLEVAGRRKRGDHVGIDVNEVELRRARQRLRHRPLRRVEDRNILHASDTDAGLLLELGDHRLHRHQVRRPDHPADIGGADGLGGGDGALLHGCSKGERHGAGDEICNRQSDAAFDEAAP